jgi:hypothetical protein
LNQESLYDQFKLDEPWDSPHNKELLSRRPEVYAPPSNKAGLIPQDRTFMHVFVGKGTVFENPSGESLQAIYDDGGTSNTLLAIEGGKPVPWTKPEDLVSEPDQPFPDIRGPFQDIRVVRCDGGTFELRQDLPDCILRAFVSRHARDKEKFSLLDLLPQ